MSSTHPLGSLLKASALPSNEAKILLAFILDKHYQLPRSALLSKDDLVLNATALAEWYALESRRLSGEPIAYLLGSKGFYNIELNVAPGVLIPRPETELLVDIALAEIQRLGGRATILDLGTGSGAIALAIANNAEHVRVLATDQSKEALTIAQLNAQALGLQNQVQFAQGSWYEALNPGKLWDIIVSNPPYIAQNDAHLSQGDLRFEPSSALTDGGNGLRCLQSIISEAGTHLKPGGLLAVEHGYDQSEEVHQLMQNASMVGIELHRDLAGHGRITSGRCSVLK